MAAGESMIDQKEYRRQWKLDNAEHVKEYNKKYYARYRIDNIEHLREKDKQWYKDNSKYKIQYILDHRDPKKHSRNERNRRARLNNTLGSHTIEELQTLYDKQRGICWCCEQYIPFDKMTVDHIIPITWDGSTNYISNIQLICNSCNSSKGNHHDTYYEIGAKQ